MKGRLKMLKIERTVLPSPEQWDIIIEGMRNAMNSWAKSDSYATHIENPETLNTADFEFFLGDADHDLMMRLAEGGSTHAKYRRMIPVFVTINAPLYWWKEFDTYKVGTVTNSCSTMHKIHAKEFELDDFSYDYLDEYGIEALKDDIFDLNYYRNEYLLADKALSAPGLKESKRKHFVDKRTHFFRQMIQRLSSAYNQKRTVMLNYEVLVNIYHTRKNHKLYEWHTFCDWIESLPHSDLITGE
jgi:hypothetical protein